MKILDSHKEVTGSEPFEELGWSGSEVMAVNGTTPGSSDFYRFSP